MKKIVFAIVLVLTIGLSASAQDFFIKSGESYGDRTGSGSGDISGVTPAFPKGSVGGENGDQPAPLGSGLIILTALGAGYAIKRSRE